MRHQCWNRHRLQHGAGDAAEDVGAESAELVVDEVAVAEVAIDLSAAVPAGRMSADQSAAAVMRHLPF